MAYAYLNPVTGQPATFAVAPFTGTAGNDAVISSRAAWVAGWSVRETTGLAAAQLDIYSGTNVGGTPIVRITLAANESARDLLPLPGLPAEGGLYVNCVSGSVDASLYVSVEA